MWVRDGLVMGELVEGVKGRERRKHKKHAFWCSLFNEVRQGALQPECVVFFGLTRVP